MSTSDPSTAIDVDLTRSTNGIWLVKVPKYLSQILSEYGDSAINGEVGRLVLRPPSQKSGKEATKMSPAARTKDVSFCLNDQIMKKIKEKNSSKDYKLPPQEHRFCFTDISDGVLRTVYSRTKNHSNSPTREQISVVGKVIRRAEIRPVENEQYMSMKRKHFETSQEPVRKAQMIDKIANVYKPKRDHEANIQRKKNEVAPEKLVRIPEEIVIDRIFKAFTKNQYISMSSLQTITQQPRNFLQELVKRYCNYNNAGHTYELKQQYRHYGTQKEEKDDDDENDDDIEDDDDDTEDDDDNNT
ncbi:unnamed protein product [Adineta steineri]|uniref:General transcription factor IIF subunit 2 n=1 Tax=Adineta steineri TaxID=433720 RepID=A0A815UZP2_9BILA|nr:unnamed protein product [Adineta steineri]CAF4158074.1 unnamed protein product [Adineta steineri]